MTRRAPDHFPPGLPRPRRDRTQPTPGTLLDTATSTLTYIAVVMASGRVYAARFTRILGIAYRLAAQIATASRGASCAGQLLQGE